MPQKADPQEILLQALALGVRDYTIILDSEAETMGRQKREAKNKDSGQNWVKYGYVLTEITG